MARSDRLGGSAGFVTEPMRVISGPVHSTGPAFSIRPAAHTAAGVYRENNDPFGRRAYQQTVLSVTSTSPREPWCGTGSLGSVNEKDQL